MASKKRSNHRRQYVYKEKASAGKIALKFKPTERQIAGVFGLPLESVKLVLPSGRKARSDKSIGAFLSDWEYWE